jgi:hypothetical protein
VSTSRQRISAALIGGVHLSLFPQSVKKSVQRDKSDQRRRFSRLTVR